MNTKLSLLSISILSSIFPAFADVNPDVMLGNAPRVEVITVSGDFTDKTLQQTPASIAVITSAIINQRNAQHLEDVLNTAANINFAAGASRARFYQIRGIGERSQFVDNVNPSVGLLVDGIDYSGIGTIASLFDIDQVEIFRGPQGTRFGADAMAGMINLNGKEADGNSSGKAELSYGNYNSSQVAIADGGTIADGWYYRAAIQKIDSDGFIDNDFLHRDDTNGTDELGARTKLRWLANDQWQFDLTGHYFDLDNGYDAFSLDNNRHTLSDQPGFDRQRTRALGLKSHYRGFITGNMTLDVSVNNTDLAYGYDEDWSFVGLHPFEYSSFDHYFRDHDNLTIDWRFNAKDGQPSQWVVGLYRQEKSIDLTRNAVFGFTPIFTSDYQTHRSAVYGQRDWQLNSQTTLTTGLRVEQITADYDDSVSASLDTDDIMWGGKISLTHEYHDDLMVYASFSRGYKAGGVNGEAIAKALLDGEDTTVAFLQQRTSFDPEILHSFELGVKGWAMDQKLSLALSAFYSDRKDLQAKGFVTEDVSGSQTGDAPIFVGYIENAAGGTNYGLEAELDYQFNQQIQLFASLGWLATKIEHFVAQDGTNMDGRDQAHAPQYQYNVGIQYDINDHWFVVANAEGKDDFYFSMSHNAQSSSVNLVNLSVNYHVEDWELSLWGRNIFDRDYAVRGFSFGNDPRDDYATHTYTQLGEPGRYGATVRYHF